MVTGERWECPFTTVPGWHNGDFEAVEFDCLTAQLSISPTAEREPVAPTFSPRANTVSGETVHKGVESLGFRGRLVVRQEPFGALSDEGGEPLGESQSDLRDPVGVDDGPIRFDLSGQFATHVLGVAQL